MKEGPDIVSSMSSPSRLWIPAAIADLLLILVFAAIGATHTPAETSFREPSPQHGRSWPERQLRGWSLARGVHPWLYGHPG